MKKIYTLLFLAFTFLVTRTMAQTLDCNPQFTVAVTGNSVQCVPVLTGDPSIVHIWNFGDGGMSTLSNPAHSYNNCGPYIIKHVIRRYNPNGVMICTDSTIQTITIQCSTPCNLVAGFNFAPQPTQPNVFAFSNTSTGLAAGDSIRWTFGDGSAPSFDLNTVHTFPGPGTYNVCLRIKRITTPGTAPCVSEICHAVVINNTTPCNIQPSYTVSVPNTSQPNVLVFTNTTAGSTPNTVVTWTFGDGTSGTGNIVTHTYTQTGPFNVCMHVALSNTCSSDTCGPVTVTIPTTCNMQANFSFAPVTAQPNTIAFTNTSSGFAAGDSIRWTFGDGSGPSFDLNPTHTFPGPGTYNVCLRIKKNGQPAGTAPCVREMCRIVVINGPAPCNLVPTFTIAPVPSQPNVLVFTNTTAGTTPNTVVNWNFGDGTSGTGNVVTHTYTQTGPFNVCMHVAVSSTCSADTCVSVAINIPNTCNLQANFSFAPVTTQPNTIAFTNTSLGLAAGDSIRWTFGDGSGPSYDLNPTHTFVAGGVYTVCLRIKKNNTTPGTPPCVSEICRQVSISVPGCNLNPSFTFQVSPNQPNVFTFTNTTITASAPAVSWIFGDNTTGTGNIVTHTYNAPGTYRVCMRIAVSNTCASDTCITITVNGTTPPTCNLQANFTWQTSPTTTAPVVYFQNTSGGFAAGDSIHWTFGDGSSSFDLNPVHTYTAPGTYRVCLRVRKNPTAPGTAPCISETCRTITVGGTPPPPPPVNCDSVRVRYTFIRDAFMPNKIYFITISNFPVMQESWTITPLNNSGSTITLNQYNPAWVFNQTGAYRVCLRAVTQGNCIKEFCDTVNINAVAQQCQLMAYPNPATSQVTVNAVLTAPSTIYGFLYNSQNILLQRITRSGLTGSNPVTFNVANLPAGYYTIRLYYNGRVCVARFQKL